MALSHWLRLYMYCISYKDYSTDCILVELYYPKPDTTLKTIVKWSDIFNFSL